MGLPGCSDRAVRFGVFEIDLRGGELRKQGVRLRLQEQPFKVLAALLEHPGEVDIVVETGRSDAIFDAWLDTARCDLSLRATATFGSR